MRNVRKYSRKSKECTYTPRNVPQVRKSAQACLPYIMAHVGYAGMVDKCGSVDAKSKKTIQVRSTQTYSIQAK